MSGLAKFDRLGLDADLGLLQILEGGLCMSHCLVMKQSLITWMMSSFLDRVFGPGVANLN
jgi:hypothetical protein